MSELSCPRCKSPDVRRFAMLHKEGVATSHSSTTVSATVGGEYGVGSASTSTVSTTKLAAETAPPAAKDVITPGFFAVLSGLGLFSTFGIPGMWRIIWLVILLVSVPMLRARRRFNRDVLPGLMERWNKSFLCSRCGEAFEAAV
jgi:hypothetical protein